MICYICDRSNAWHSMGDINKARELLVCMGCGNVAYRVDESKEEEMKAYYRTEYRPEPNAMNLVTTAHKKQYIALFLKDFLESRKNTFEGRNGQTLITGDVGCATGYIPAWLRSLGHKATGCELTVTYRRFAEHFYHIPITEELEPKHRYDLITIYHVLEHLIRPDLKLKKYVELLADDGRILVSTPEWFDTLEEASGSAIQSFEHLFHKDHINVFSKRSLQNLFWKAGLEIEKEDHLQYGQTYLLKKAAAGAPPGTPLPKEFVENHEEQIQKILTQKKAIDLYVSGNAEAATQVWPRFPEAWIRLIHDKTMKDPVKQADLYAEAHKHLPENVRLVLAHGVWRYQNEEYEPALQAFFYVMKHRPNEDVLVYIGWCWSHLGQSEKAMAAYQEAININPQKWTECMNWICREAARQPCWEERAIAATKEQLLKESGLRPVLRDPVMEPEAAPKLDLVKP